MATAMADDAPARAFRKQGRSLECAGGARYPSASQARGAQQISAEGANCAAATGARGSCQKMCLITLASRP